jgi:low affinity Fe/Cu permease
MSLVRSDFRNARRGGDMARTNAGLGRRFERFSTSVTRWTGSTTAFALACGTIVAWAATGPIFDYSDTWQLVINTGTTIVTFLMVFLIQRTQNKDSLAVQLKLNELVAAIEGSSNRLIDVEDLDEKELRTLHEYYGRLAQMAKKDYTLTESHSVEEAEERHATKLERRRSHRGTARENGN